MLGLNYLTHNQRSNNNCLQWIAVIRPSISTDLIGWKKIPPKRVSKANANINLRKTSSQVIY